MKLYIKAGACSLASHIATRELNLDVEVVPVDLATKKTAAGDDYLRVNPKGYIPALAMDNGEVLTEGPAILQYLADLKPEAGLAPANGTMARYRLQEWLNFITSELHKGIGSLFNPAMPDAFKEVTRARAALRLDVVAAELAGKTWLMGEQYTVADAYLFTVLRWTARTGIDLAKWPALVAYVARVEARPAVAATLKAEAA